MQFPSRNETYSVANRATVTAFGSKTYMYRRTIVFTAPPLLRDEACREALPSERHVVIFLHKRIGQDTRRRKIGMACSAQLCRDHGSGGKETAGRIASAKSAMILPGFATNVSRFKSTLQETQVQRTLTGDKGSIKQYSASDRSAILVELDRFSHQIKQKNSFDGPPLNIC